MQHLVEHSSSGRLHSQDATLSASTSTTSVSSQIRDPDALLSLPEFIRESVPDAVQLKMQLADPRALLSLPEFVREPVSEPPTRPSPPPVRRKSFKGMRNRSMSAPPLAWLLQSSSRPSSPVQGAETRRPRSAKSRRTGSSSGITPPPQSKHSMNQFVIRKLMSGDAIVQPNWRCSMSRSTTRTCIMSWCS